MYLKDFSYAGYRLSDFGCIPCYLVTNASNTVSLGSNLSFETIKNPLTYTHKIVKADYDEVISATFDIVKNCESSTNVFNDGEISSIMRWLNRKNYAEFRPIYNDEGSEIYFNGSFNISAIYMNGEVVGFTLTFTANSPFGYEGIKETTINIDEAYGEFTFYNNSDELGYLYPSLFKITCNADGNLSILNSMDNTGTFIANCLEGEVITLDCTHKIITSSINRPNLCNSFNYTFPRFLAKNDTKENIITVSIPCEIVIEYSFIRKVGIIV